MAKNGEIQALFHFTLFSRNCLMIAIFWIDLMPKLAKKKRQKWQKSGARTPEIGENQVVAENLILCDPPDFRQFLAA